MTRLKFFFEIVLACSLLACGQVKENLDPAVTQTFSEQWKFRAGEGDSLWSRPDFDDSQWLDVVSTLSLKDQSVALDNGFGWYRKTVQLSDSLLQSLDKKGELVLHLGKFAAAEEVYFNGRLIGKTGDFPPNYMGYNDGERNYLIAKEAVLPKGDNVIAIKFHNGWGAGGFLSSAPVSISSAETNDKLSVTIEVPDADYIFLSPDTIRATALLENKNEWPVEGELSVMLLTDDHQVLQTDRYEVKVTGKSTYSAALKSIATNRLAPGFYQYKVEFIRHSQPASADHLMLGFDPEKIQSPVDAQADFQEFWQNNLKELAKVAPQYKMTLQPQYSQLDYKVYLVEMRSLGNVLIRGYYAQPKRDGRFPVIIEYMGYGSKPYPPNQSWDGFAYFIPSIREQGLNESNPYSRWILSGLDNKNNYYYRGAFMDVVRALDFVCSRPEIDTEKIAVRGASQGGALSFVAAALDHRVKVAAPSVPFLSDYRDYFKIASWPKSDFDVYMEQHPEAKWDDIYTLLSYFDIKNLAPLIECPVFMGFGVQDQVCPPHINFAAYNQVKPEKRWMASPEFGHSVSKVFNEAAVEYMREKFR